MNQSYYLIILFSGAKEAEVGFCNTATETFLHVIQPAAESIVFESNLYATQKGRTLNLKKEEFFTFLGINFLMSYHKLPSWKHYWCISDDLGVTLVRKAMSCDRFDLILSNLHVNDNMNIPNNNTDKAFDNHTKQTISRVV